MMTSLAQTYSPHPGGMQQHAGMAQGHPMGHNPGHPGQPGPGMQQQMHMGVSGPPQVTQGQAMMGGMPPGAVGPNAHAIQHLGPNPQQQAQQMFQPQAMFASNPQLQHMHQQHQMMAQHRQQVARQAMLAQQYSGMPVGMANGLTQMTPAQYQALRGSAGPMRPVNLPSHLQQQQQQAEHSLQQQHQAQQHQHQQQQQIMMAQQMAMQHANAQAQAQAQAQGNTSQPQPNQMNPQQQNMQQAQNAMLQHQQQQQQQAHAAAVAAVASQQNQGQPQGQPQAQPPQSNPQTAPQQVPQQSQGMQQQVTTAMLQQQQRQGEKLKGRCLMQLMAFADHLSSFSVAKQRDDLQYWINFVDRFFSPKGVFRHSLWLEDEQSNKQFEITYPALPRYFHIHFEGGIKQMQLIMEKGHEKELPNNNHYIESQKSSFVYWFENGSQVIASGTLKAHFDSEQKIDLLEFITSSHEEYLPRSHILAAARPLHEWSKEWHKVNSPDGKSSPEMNKKKNKQMKSPLQPPPEIDIPESQVKPTMGITQSVFRFLELAEVMIQMTPLFGYSHHNPSLTPHNALEQYVATIAANGVTNLGHQPNSSGPRTPAMGNFPMGASPAQAHLQLPGGSPHISSPAQAPGMQLQQSQHGTSSSGPSANTSPNANNKRRRPSTVKAEEENQVNLHSTQKTQVKPSPRIGGKRQKPNPA